MSTARNVYPLNGESLAPSRNPSRVCVHVARKASHVLARAATHARARGFFFPPHGSPLPLRPPPTRVHVRYLCPSGLSRAGTRRLLPLSERKRARLRESRFTRGFTLTERHGTGPKSDDRWDRRDPLHGISFRVRFDALRGDSVSRSFLEPICVGTRLGLGRVSTLELRPRALQVFQFREPEIPNVDFEFSSLPPVFRRFSSSLAGVTLR